ncbi:MAG: DUF4257 domain-containing protein [Candidatus Cloacimonadota bacterium]|nr:MAG: DUF4257 domain-containing protein [Candidatus Cloacimonadota bacterium]
MYPLFAYVWIDILVAIILGAVGGLGLGLLQEKGLEMPHWHRENSAKFADLGFVADVFIGSLAAVIVYALNPPVGIFQLLAITLTAGIGGSAILKSYIKGIEVTKKASVATQSQQIAKIAIDRLKIYKKSAPKELKDIDVRALDTQLNKLQKGR